MIKTTTKAEVEQLEKIAMYWKYNFVLLAKGKMDSEEKNRVLYRGALTVDTITPDEISELRKRL